MGVSAAGEADDRTTSRCDSAREMGALSAGSRCKEHIDSRENLEDPNLTTPGVRTRLDGRLGVAMLFANEILRTCVD